jgi:DNA-binding MarR family transcriptional regulator
MRWSGATRNGVPSMPSTDPATDPVPSPLARLTFETGGGDHLTIANLVADLHRLVFLPGDQVIWALTTHAAPLARVLGVSSNDYGGVLSGFVSCSAWIVAFVSIAITIQAIVDFDRRVTSAIRRLFATVALRVRIARTLMRQRIRGWLANRGRPAKQEVVAKEIEISPAQLQVLRLHAKLPPGCLLGVSEAASEAGTRASTMKKLLEGLHGLGLLGRSRGVADGEDAYALTRAGMALLVSRKLADPPLTAPPMRRASRSI